MKLLAVLLASLCVLALPSQAHALYDPRTTPNNKVGVHILDPNEIDRAHSIVNANGGEWGYVIVPIQPSDRDQAKWQTFMHTCRDKHLIPIIRITTIPLGGTWDTARDTDLVDFANFLGELDWPVENRYIVLFNEVNRDTEWGGKVDPAAYARIVRNAYTIFKERNRDFFMLGPALDSALPNSATSMTAAAYMQGMQKEDPLVWTYIEGWASHSYPNPGFSSAPSKTGWQSIVSYKTEIASLRIAPKPVFITETGWDQTVLPDTKIDAYWKQAFNIWSQDPDVVAVTPFVLQGGSQFAKFSLYSPSGELNPSGRTLIALEKKAGQPVTVDASALTSPSPAGNLDHTSDAGNVTFRQSPMSLRIENFFRTLFGLTQKGYITIGTQNLAVEIMTSPRDWEKGLSGRDTLPPDTGMLFRFPRDHVPIFWMKDMKFPIDIIWINDNFIVDIVKNVPVPQDANLPTYSPHKPVDTVLEVPAGYSDSHGWGPGIEMIIYE